MQTNKKHLSALKAVDLMSRDVVTIRQETSMWDAAGLLMKNQVSGAPVVDAAGKCVGVLSAADFVRVAQKGIGLRFAPMPHTCSYQTSGKSQDGREIVCCTLPLGVCPIQEKQKDADGKEMAACTDPHSVLTDWQTVEMEDVHAAKVGCYMTADPVTVPPDTPVRTLARRMIDARIHRVIVVDAQHRPIGVVSSVDILAVVAFADDELCQLISES